jgi:hypothetical protein
VFGVNGSDLGAAVAAVVLCVQEEGEGQMKLTNIGYVAKMNKQRQLRQRGMLRNGGSRKNGKSTVCTEEVLRRLERLKNSGF